MDSPEDVGTSNDYANSQAVLASSTGNVYGIYDLSGNASEYAASYYNGSELLENGITFASKGGKSNEFVTAYSMLNYIEGDGTKQTQGWNNDSGKFPEDYPFFRHGGNNQNGYESGVFCFWELSGNAYTGDSFRLCLII